MTLIRDGDAVIVVDPGMVADRRLILDPLAALGVAPEARHRRRVQPSPPRPHAACCALPECPVPRLPGDLPRRCLGGPRGRGFRGRRRTPRLLETRGHTNEDISTVVETDDGVVVLTHLWWMADGPLEDPFAPDADVLRASRQRVLALNPTQIVPGHGPAFVPGDSTPGLSPRRR